MYFHYPGARRVLLQFGVLRFLGPHHSIRLFLAHLHADSNHTNAFSVRGHQQVGREILDEVPEEMGGERGRGVGHGSRRTSIRYTHTNATDKV